MSKIYFGIMQGRLLPKYKDNFQAHPVGYWQDEFKIASKLNLDCIEFILDHHLAKSNPLLSDIGLDLILNESKKNNVFVKSICADYFMECPIFSEKPSQKKENFDILKKLFLNAKKIGVSDIVIPFVDKSSLLNNKKKYDLSVCFFKKFFQKVKVTGVNLCLESDLPPQEFFNFVNDINHPQIKINYDTGNSASMGYNFHDEFNTYGHLVTNIHIKDRKLHEGSIELGYGDCNFKDIFNYLAKMNYHGLFILQAYRNEDAISSLMPQYNYVRNYINKYF